MAEQRLIPKIGSKINLKDYDPSYTGGYDKERAAADDAQFEKRLADLQEMLYAQGSQSLLIVLQAMDAGGKDSTIKKVFLNVNPQGVVVTSFKAPSAEDLAHDFLWRIHQRTPGKGYIGIFNRSHYEDVLIVRVNKLVPREVWEKRYDRINEFERQLTESGTRILKFYLHISKDEQKKRFQDRLDRPDKWWKFNPDDLTTRARWDDYMEAYEAVLTFCNTEYAPWYIIPANHKWYRDLVITRAIVEALENMKVAYPKPKQNLSGYKIPD
ncbi:MAG TPA: polyphosphate kinase 2 family protein [Phototrophicaceae bacterium]|nr:polyphosphate kinase 2 family protein [Phototrophicaceae bacterium]